MAHAHEPMWVLVLVYIIQGSSQVILKTGGMLGICDAAINYTICTTHRCCTNKISSAICHFWRSEENTTTDQFIKFHIDLIKLQSVAKRRVFVAPQWLCKQGTLGDPWPTLPHTASRTNGHTAWPSRCNKAQDTEDTWVLRSSQSSPLALTIL
jgi:hypothetical protein